MKKIYSYIIVFQVISIVTILFFIIQNRNIEKNELDEIIYSLQVKEKDNYWIYEVYNNDNLFISQDYIPAVKGKQVFKTKADAEKIGQLVISKLSKNMFPAINKNDLKNNSINFDKI